MEDGYKLALDDVIKKMEQFDNYPEVFELKLDFRKMKKNVE